jgi:diguanylate cyclase (GGDEF)-like protein
VSVNPKITKILTWAIIAFGAIICGYAVFNFEVGKIDWGLITLTFATIFLGSFFQLQLPRTKIHISLSECAVFYAIIIYSPSIAIILSALEALNSSFAFRRKGINIKSETILLNIATISITTFIAGFAAWYFFPNELANQNFQNISSLVGVLWAIAIIQFFVNSVLVAVVTSLRNGKSLWKVWSENCLDALAMYFIGGLVAGLLIKAIEQINPVLLLATAVISAVFYITYRRYADDLRKTAAQAEQAERERAEQAERHIEELQHYIREQEKTSQELRESRERFRHAAFHDALTDLPNRNLFIETLKFLLERHKHSPNKKFAVLFLDLNRFKTINDSLGHSMGDRLILNVAKRLSSLVREGDLVARFSGDEFAIILSDVQIADDAVQFAEIIRRKILSPFTINGRQVFTSVSIGIAFSNTSYDEAEDILRDADMAMYHAKALNRDYIVFDPTMHTRAVTLLQIETDLRNAIERDELMVYYQPIINLATMNIMGFEALMRWNHPQRGIVPPTEFIPIAEDTGLIIDLTLWILRKSCNQMIEWQKKSPLNESLVISVNLSGKHFAQTDMIEQIRRIINETGINPACLKLEITESAVMGNAEKAITLLKNLRLLGLQLSIDDFGTGYSSLSYLHRFPIDMLKVDRSFVGTMEDGTENGEIVRTIIALAKTLQLNVIAEGIETIHQLHQLRILGCEYGQGYLFSRPVPFTEAEELLNDPTRWQNIIPDNNPAIVAQNREFTQLRLAK